MIKHKRRGKLNILMISIGDNILSNPTKEEIQRQRKYADTVGYIDMIVYSPIKNKLTPKHYRNLSIYPTKSLGMFSFVFDVFRITSKIIRKKKIDIITTQDPFGTALSGYFLKKKYHIPLHIQNHSSFINNKNWINERPILFNIFNKIAYFTLKKADRLRVVNSLEKQKYIDILKIDSEKIDIAPVPVNTDFWQEKVNEKDKKNFVKKYGIQLLKPTLTWAGRPAKAKNLPYLFKVAGLVNQEIPVNFIIAGKMDNSQWNLRHLELLYKIKPIYTGFLNHNLLRILYNITDIFLNTSNYEGFGLVVSDAQACGTVAISRKTAGPQDIIDDKRSGYLISKNEIIFSQRIIELLNDDSSRMSMSMYSKFMVKKKFNKEKMFEQIVLSIERTIND